jgi:hypothetical protein
MSMNVQRTTEGVAFRLSVPTRLVGEPVVAGRDIQVMEWSVKLRAVHVQLTMVVAIVAQRAQTRRVAERVNATRDTVAMELPALISTSVKRTMVGAVLMAHAQIHLVAELVDATTDIPGMD